MISFEISARLGPPSTIDSDSIPTPKIVATRNMFSTCHLCRKASLLCQCDITDNATVEPQVSFLLPHKYKSVVISFVHRIWRALWLLISISLSCNKLKLVKCQLRDH